MKVILCMLAAYGLHTLAISEWAFGGPDHRLHYRYDARGNAMMDFSSAGYRSGGVKLPSPAVCQRLTPSPGDNTARIQAALDRATGAVVLARGEYEVAGTLAIARGGVVLRGETGAVIRLTGKPHRFLEIHGSGVWHEVGAPAPILDAFVPAGSATLQVKGASAFHSGDRVLVLRPVTAEWLQFMSLETPRAGTVIRTDRAVDAVDGDRITLDAPLSDSLDCRFATASLVRYSFPGRIAEVGVEGLRIDAPSDAQFTAVSFDAVEDAWARDLEIRDTQNAIAIGATARRLTIVNVRVNHSGAPAVGAADFSLQGTQIFLDHSSVTGQSASPVVTESSVTGPLVILNFTAGNGGVAAHPGWTTGLLVDGGKFPGATERAPGLAFATHDIGWAVAWNTSSPFLLVQQPPGGALNWCVGCVGTALTAANSQPGVFDSFGKTVDPASLYLQQLRDRLGPDAVRNIGY
jgi:hypothetical protein